jgi:Tol biopolymer transport system component
VALSQASALRKRPAHGKLLLAVILACSLIACRSTHPVEPPLSPAVFTPDGRSIVFSLSHGATCFLYKTEIATGTKRRLTQAAAGCEFDPTFSQDGKRLAFMRAPENGARAALIVANADGTGERIVVPADEDNLNPVFVADSGQVLFLRSAAFEHHSPLVDNRRHKFDLFAADTASGHVSMLTHREFYELSHVSASSDGKQFLLTVSTYPEGDQFLLVQADNPAAPTISLQPKVPQNPDSPVIYNGVWLPDGRSILFNAASQPPGGANFDYNIYRLTIANGSIERLTQLTGLLDGFSVSADGKKVVLLRQGEYSVLDLSTHQLTPVRLQKP